MPGSRPEDDALPLPPALSEALAAKPAARTLFNDLSPSCRREYVTWIAGAKRDETRARRVEQTLERIASGQRRPATQPKEMD